MPPLVEYSSFTSSPKSAFSHGTIPVPILREKLIEPLAVTFILFVTASRAPVPLKYKALPLTEPQLVLAVPSEILDH